MLGAEGELIVVEQETDTSKRMSRGFCSDRVRHLVIPKPSTTRARNLGIQEARGKIIIFLDDDVIPQPGLIEGHLVAYDDPTVGGVAGRIIDQGNAPKAHVDPRAFDPVDGWRYTHFDHTTRMEVAHAPTCNLSFRRSLLLQVGGFDPGFRLAWREDSDLCFRVRQCGYRLLFEPSATVVHLSASAGGTRQLSCGEGPLFREFDMYRKHFRHYRDNLYFLRKHFRGWKRLKWVLDAYYHYVGISRWPWRWLAKSGCFVAALVESSFRRHPAPPYFETQGFDGV